MGLASASAHRRNVLSAAHHRQHHFHLVPLASTKAKYSVSLMHPILRLCVVQLITTLYNLIQVEAEKDNAKWGINDITRGYT